jgi:hypothetical protein
MYLPVKVLKAFKPGEEGKIKYEDGKEATIDAKRSKDCVMMDEAALQTYDNMIKLNDCELFSLLSHSLRRHQQKLRSFMTSAL